MWQLDRWFGRRSALRAVGVATVAHREGINVRPKDLVPVTCAKLSVIGTVKFERVGEPFRGNHAPFMQG
eukprot:123124-Pelagomonas_calceolata.AAC.1